MPECFTDTCSEPALLRLGLWWTVGNCFEFACVSTMALPLVRSSNVHLCESPLTTPCILVLLETVDYKHA